MKKILLLMAGFMVLTAGVGAQELINCSLGRGQRVQSPVIPNGNPEQQAAQTLGLPVYLLINSSNQIQTASKN